MVVSFSTLSIAVMSTRENRLTKDATFAAAVFRVAELVTLFDFVFAEAAAVVLDFLFVLLTGEAVVIRHFFASDAAILFALDAEDSVLRQVFAVLLAHSSATGLAVVVVDFLFRDYFDVLSARALMEVQLAQLSLEVFLLHLLENLSSRKVADF